MYSDDETFDRLHPFKKIRHIFDSSHRVCCVVPSLSNRIQDSESVNSGLSESEERPDTEDNLQREQERERTVFDIPIWLVCRERGGGI